MEKRVVFQSAWLPYALVAPQIVITLVFFFWPAAQAVWYSFQLQDAFGLNSQFVGLDNFRNLFKDDNYLESFKVTALFSVLVAFFGIAISLLSIAFVIYLGIRRLIVGPEAEGLFTLFGIAFFLIGVTLFGIGLLGEYVGRIYQQVRERPRYLIQAVLEKTE